MPNAPDWVESIRNHVEKIVLEELKTDGEVVKTSSIEEEHSSLHTKTIDISEGGQPITRHAFVITIDTTELKETEEGERTIVSGVQTTELMIGNPDVIIACLFSFLKNERVRPLLLKAVFDGLDLGGFEQSVVPSNPGALLDLLTKHFEAQRN